MRQKVLPIVTYGYTLHFFAIHWEDEDMSLKPHLVVRNTTCASFALELADRGLSPLGIDRGDYLLFSTVGLIRPTGQIVLIRQEEEYIIREAFWSGDTTILCTPGEIYKTMSLPTENIRIVGVLDNVLKTRADLEIVSFG